jgi:hypothetical protein
MKLENHGEHRLALAEYERIMDSASTLLPDGRFIEVLVQAISDFEDEHYPIGKPEAFVCPNPDCRHHAAPVLNKAGDDIACAKCGGPLHG